jgi:hypothetical protein
LVGEAAYGDTARRMQVRQLVIAAKDHARWHEPKSQPDASKRHEMVSWMFTWLQNPPVFREWIKIRRSLLRE